MKAGKLLRMVIAPGALLLAGCVSSNVTSTPMGSRSLQPISTESVLIVPNVPKGSYYVADLVAKANGSDQKAVDANIAELKKRCAQIGANRLIMKNYKIYEGNGYWMDAHAYFVEKK